MSLTGAIYIGLSGMDAYSSGLQVISNNVGNLDTNGYKAETVNFSDLYNGTGEGGLPFQGPSAQGGGEGVEMETPTTDFSQGTLQQTGNPLDLAVQGDGFLVLQSNGQTFYTRTGSFNVAQDGQVTLEGTPTGTTYSLTVLNSANTPTPVDVNASDTSAPVATTTITLGDNLSSQATTATVSNISVFDSEGAAQTWTITATPATSSSSSTSGTTTWDISVADQTGATVGTGTIEFNGGQVVTGQSTVTINSTPTDASAPLDVTLDFSAVTNFAAGTTSTIQTTNVNGNASGTLTGVTVDSSGDLEVSYSNNTTKSLGSVAIANFQNPQLLTNLGGGIYRNSNQAQSQLVPSGSANAGTVVAGEIESSNVNLTQEFGDLILIQRGYQASSEVISTSNDMIQQLFGIRGQGA